jgi:hypothetical protein
MQQATLVPPVDLPTRVALLEAKMKVVVLALEGMIVAFFSALIAYFFKS